MRGVAYAQTVQSSRDRSLDVGLIVVAVVWGSSYLTAKSLLSVMSVTTLLSLRLSVSAIILGPLWWARRRPVTRRELLVAAWGGVLLLVTFLLETAGVAHTSATNAGLIISFAIILTPVLESIASRHWLPAPYFVATTVAIVGVGLLVSSHGFHRPSGGDLLMLAAALGRASAVTSSGHMTKGYDYDAMFYTFIQCSVGAVILTVVSVPHDIEALGRLSVSQWGALLYLGVFCSVIGLMLQLWAVRATSASRASLLLGTEPLFAVAVSVVIGHESMTILGLVGGVLIVVATYAAQGMEIRHREAAHPLAASSPPTLA